MEQQRKKKQGGFVVAKKGNNRAQHAGRKRGREEVPRNAITKKQHGIGGATESELKNIKKQENKGKEKDETADALEEDLEGREEEGGERKKKRRKRVHTRFTHYAYQH